MTPKLIPSVLRCTPRIGFIPAGGLAVVMGVVAGRQPLSAEYRFLPTRLAVLAIVIAVGFVFDDPAKPTTDSLPSPLRLRRGIRVLYGLIMAAGLFAIVILLASDDMNLVAAVNSDSVAPVETEEVLTMHPEFPWGRLALETATMIGFTLGIAAAISRRSESEPGRIATGVMLGVYAVTWMIPETYRPWASPMEQRWTTSAIWWWVALGIVWGLAVILSWDSRARRHLPRTRGSHRRANPTSRVGSTRGGTGP
jgi:hypothetical protein